MVWEFRKGGLSFTACNMRKNEDFSVTEGKAKVLVSAPHAFSNKRHTLDKQIRPPEEKTKNIVSEVVAQTRCYGIFTCRNIDYDPNFDKKNKYKDTVGKLCKSDKIKFFLDIHGLNPLKEYDFAIYYERKYLKSRRKAHELNSFLSKGALRGCTTLILNFLPQFENGEYESLSQYCNTELGIPAVQLEIAKYIRDDDELIDALIKNLCAFVKQQ